ncbi:MAG: hypothetical protein WC312_03815 [Candidatus Omnitrophota bacterium]|jgi:hypothetical protein
MFKKLTLALLACLFIASQAIAGQVVNTLIATTTFNAVTTSATGATYIGDCKKVAFFVNYDETEVGASISAAVTVQVSWDNSTWLSASFFDYAGGTTLQASETISSDGNYYFWFNPDLTVPYVKVTLTATNTDADDLLTMYCKIVKLQ